jgi:hypothetical protein
VRVFRLDQLSPHQVTVPDDAAVVSPRTNAPRLGNANTVAVALSEDGW